MYILLVIVLLGALSPLLTVANLWQLKEWRIDRLQEHFRSEGLFRQLFGVVRPAIALLFAVIAVVDLLFWYLYLPVAFGLLCIAQFVLRRQQMPVWTMKAAVLIITALVIDLILTLTLPALLVPLIPLAQPFVLAVAWALFFPVDRALKNRIIRKAASVRSLVPDVTVIGITGSVGKTTTKELLRHLLGEKEMLATPEYVNSEIGVARWLTRELSTKKPPDILVVEMGAYKAGEIATLCSFSKPKIGIITAVGKQHLALFKTQEALCNAKAELVECLPEDGRAYLNVDSELCATIGKKASCPVTTIGTGGTADVEAYEIEETADGFRFQCDGTKFFVPLHGTHNVTNVLLAIAVARDLGLSDADIARRMQSFTPPDKTFSVLKTSKATVLNDTHNASPSSFRAAIAWARNQPIEEKVLLTSGLQELGTTQDRIHTEMGANAANVFTRVVFLHKRNAKYFEKGFGKSVELLSKTTAPTAHGSLIVCVGRMPQKTIDHLLPS